MPNPTLYTYRVVVVYSDSDKFFGASGYYGSRLEAQGAMVDIARTWIGLGVIDVRADGSFQVIREDQPTVTYSVMQERAFLSQAPKPFVANPAPVEPELEWNRFRISAPRAATWHTAHIATGSYDARRIGRDGYRLEFRKDDDTAEFIGAYPTLKEAKREAGYHARKQVAA
jgi:hypothetical protein